MECYQQSHVHTFFFQTHHKCYVRYMFLTYVGLFACTNASINQYTENDFSTFYSILQFLIWQNMMIDIVILKMSMLCW